MAKIFHLTTQSTWDKAVKRKIYDYCTLATDGFIHFSTATQYLQTANRLFRGVADLILVEINEEDFPGKIKYENLEGGTELFPHLYCSFSPDQASGIFQLKEDESGFTLIN